MELKVRVAQSQLTLLLDERICVLVPMTLNPKDASSVHQTPKSSIHRVPVTLIIWTDSPLLDSLASLIFKGFGHENAAQRPPPFNALVNGGSTSDVSNSNAGKDMLKQQINGLDIRVFPSNAVAIR
ncbi:hypothetical protein PILCRDRAFT_10270 [Piloderma croceum F 1598]|uniref:Uncharacterized protein n=1 Tax=Piloderma croceum (strain F 1598) TaxID=765440 RepID=A0A0C3AZK3_PILCF|nr:hypothetical protein PILCRDRAFT_10270 [Piloderma croceum F 1598]